MRYFPIFLNLENKPVLVVGGGEVACRKVEALLKAKAAVTIVSPKVERYLAELIEQRQCTWLKEGYSSELLLPGYEQVWATTDDPALNHQVHHDAKKLAIMVNVVDDLPYCDFITPSMLSRGRVQIAISSGGASPVLIRNIREKLEAVLPLNLSLLADFGASKRDSIKQHLPTVDMRRKFWEQFFALSDVENTSNLNQLEDLYQASLNSSLDLAGRRSWIEFGDNPELLSLKALRLMQEAELLLFPSLCPEAYIELSRRDAEREAFHACSDLAIKLNDARMVGKRICIFIPAKDKSFVPLISVGESKLSLAIES
ncbi:ferrochelatase [Vibrio sp. 10N.286.49.B3]|uniref:precorrin-2 dehydrogenase/sirohydrochlorin ferrochelatase family protein n=1 Tax=Vibrio sp. 10N.286.49.B3 TaxID=1880855 RepID=UPI000C85872F|nr:bifunctional precorrin-2 dehydrogenase/sirohydrochlorin ferrochelatase [Vibrio sp. 10N.286.49.B3]PMH46481.1 ferrochelatase [Vibrio sp. 10N.286.49.B3]